MHVQVEGEGQDIVLVHGWGMSRVAWQPVVPLLAEKYRLHLVDLPGFGRSPLASPFSLSSVVDAIADVVPEVATWVGWSLGGLIGQSFADRYPQRVERLMLVSSTPFFPAQQGWPGTRMDVLQMFGVQLEDDFRRTLRRFMVIQSMGEADAAGRVKVLREMMEQEPLPEREALRGGLDLLKYCDLRSRFHALRCPMMAVFGRLDTVVPAAAAEVMKELRPSLKTAVLEKASHALFISNPHWFAQQLSKFCLE